MVSGRGDILVTRLEFFFSRNVIFRLKINIRSRKTAGGSILRDEPLLTDKHLESREGHLARKGVIHNPLYSLAARFSGGNWFFSSTVDPWDQTHILKLGSSTLTS